MELGDTRCFHVLVGPWSGSQQLLLLSDGPDEAGELTGHGRDHALVLFASRAQGSEAVMQPLLGFPCDVADFLAHSFLSLAQLAAWNSGC